MDSSKNAYGSEEILNAAHYLSQSQQLTVSPNIISAYSCSQLLSCCGSTTRTGQRICGCGFVINDPPQPTSHGTSRQKVKDSHGPSWTAWTAHYHCWSIWSRTAHCHCSSKQPRTQSPCSMACSLHSSSRLQSWTQSRLAHPP